MIQGVSIGNLTGLADERQTFTEVFKGIPIRQVSLCEMKPLVKKLRHYHHRQTDWWVVVEGFLTLHLHDVRSWSSTFGVSQDIVLCGQDRQIVRVPPMVIHGCSVGEQGAKLLYATDQEYDPRDEFRIP